MTKFSSAQLFFLGLVFVFCFSCSKDDEFSPSVLWEDKEGNQQLQLYYNIFKAHRDQNTDSAFYYLDKLQSNAIAIDHKKWAGRAHSAKGKFYKDQGLLSEAAFQYFEAIKCFKAAEEPLYLADNYEYLGLIFALANEHLNAVSYYQAALDLYQQNDATEDYIAREHYNLSTSLMKIAKYDEAFHHITQALQISEDKQDILMVRDSYNILGAVYLEKGDYEKARQLYEKSLTIGQELPDFEEHKAAVLNNIGEAYLKEKKLHEAEHYLSRALKVKQTLNDVEFSQSTLQLLAETSLVKGDTITAINLLSQSMEGMNVAVYNTAMGTRLALMVDVLNEFRPKNKFNGYKYLSKYSSILSTNYKVVIKLKEELERLNKQYQLQLAVDKFNSNTAIASVETRKRIENWIFAIVVTIFFVSFGILGYKALLALSSAKQRLVRAERQKRGVDKVAKFVDILSRDF